ncbi:hypothetical protein DFH08DRAFT_964792 [Mycena albidolilacea]|uniref:Uncharacterized protein n=1 Tax=Mycena albidolilacea TaxID=1033008 RepID=A0AAD6ZSG9_9AGAR|nr:hypothetical protein DFH08DRAFT_964792 [Mycena albidolilacea]
MSAPILSRVCVRGHFTQPTPHRPPVSRSSSPAGSTRTSPSTDVSSTRRSPVRAPPLSLLSAQHPSRIRPSKTTFRSSTRRRVHDDIQAGSRLHRSSGRRGDTRLPPSLRLSTHCKLAPSPAFPPFSPPRPFSRPTAYAGRPPPRSYWQEAAAHAVIPPPTRARTTHSTAPSLSPPRSAHPPRRQMERGRGDTYALAPNPPFGGSPSQTHEYAIPARTLLLPVSTPRTPRFTSSATSCSYAARRDFHKTDAERDDEDRGAPLGDSREQGYLQRYKGTVDPARAPARICARRSRTARISAFPCGWATPSSSPTYSRQHPCARALTGGTSPRSQPAPAPAPAPTPASPRRSLGHVSDPPDAAHLLICVPAPYDARRTDVHPLGGTTQHPLNPSPSPSRLANQRGKEGNTKEADVPAVITCAGTVREPESGEAGRAEDASGREKRWAIRGLEEWNAITEYSCSARLLGYSMHIGAGGAAERWGHEHYEGHRPKHSTFRWAARGARKRPPWVAVGKRRADRDTAASPSVSGSSTQPQDLRKQQHIDLEIFEATQTECASCEPSGPETRMKAQWQEEAKAK